MTKPRGLGRGLDALLGAGAEAAEGELSQLPISAIRPGRYQPRTRMDDAALAELADSVRARGVLQPIVVRPLPGGEHEILAGERRWRAARLAGLERIPAVVRSVPDEVALGIGLIENIQREDLSPIEEAAGLKRLIDEFKLTHDDAARAVGRSRSAVTNLLRLLDLAGAVRDQLEARQLDMGHARALLALGKAKQVELAGQVVARGLSVRETERLVQEALAAPRVATSRRGGRPDADTRRLEESLAEALGATVEIRVRARSRGTLCIRYASLDQLELIVDRLLAK